MHLLITGANGFIGQALVRRLLDGADAATRLTLLDLRLEANDDPRITTLAGDLADPAVQQQAFATPVDTVFHLASLPGGSAERDYALGWRVNVEASSALMHHAAAQLRPPVFVFASSIAALGAPLPAHVDDDTPLHPTLSYGAQKLIGEILLRDLARRGALDGRAIRLPGIVMRPPAPTGQLSAFMSEIIRATAAGRDYVCPVSAQATLWLMSLQCVIDNLLHAAQMAPPASDGARAWTLPALHLSIAELLAAVSAHCGHDAAAHVRFQPDPGLERTFGAYPPLLAPAAEALGFHHDGDAVALVRRALASEAENAAHD